MDVVVAGFGEAVAKVGADVVRRPRHRLEHVEMVDDDAIELLADLGVVASVQPAFDALWGGPDGMYTTRLGRDRASHLNPFARMATMGLSLAFGSDAPVTPLAPWAAVRAAVHSHEPGARWTPRGAFAAHTRGGWRAAGDEFGGVLAPGTPASLAIWQCDDLVVEAPDDRVAAWSTDPRSGVPGLPSLEPGTADPVCLRTIVAGRTVYTNESVQPINPGSGT
jgi:predicted amidohydrolase YtcJ